VKEPDSAPRDPGAFAVGERAWITEPISPELALVDPDLARRARAILPERPGAVPVPTAKAASAPVVAEPRLPVRGARYRAAAAFAIKLAVVAVIVLSVGRAGAVADHVGSGSQASTRISDPERQVRGVATPLESGGRRLAPYSQLALVDIRTGRIRTVMASGGTRLVAGPSWNPDDRRILVVTQACSSCPATLAIVTTTDAHLTRLQLNGLDADDQPTGRTAWSPDGREILFAVNGRDGERELWRARAKGWRAHRLPTGDDAEQPAWSPDGKTIAYAAEVSEIHRIFFMPARGGSARVVTRGQSADQPAFSPGGRRLAFVRLDQNVSWDLCTLTLRTRAARCLTHGGANERDPSWAPGGGRLVFASDRAGGTIGARSLYVVRSDGSGLKRLTGPAFDATMPSWSPSGRSIAFVLRPILGGHA